MTNSLRSRQDLVVATILRSKLEAVVAEMEASLINTAYSATISVSKQCAAALFTEGGQLVAVSDPAYLYPMAMTAAAVIDRFQFDLSSEDVLLTNDPYGGGTRVQNFTVIAPVSDGDSITMYLAVCGQTEDFAGDVRGNFNPSATEIWAEGARCSPLRLVREGKVRKDVLQTLKLNSRNPVAFGLDIDAMLAAADVGKRRLAELLSSFGTERMTLAVDWVLDYSERRMSALLEQIPAGRYEGRSVLGHDTHGKQNLTVCVALSVSNGTVTMDFTGTDAQSAGFINATPSTTATFALLPVIAAFGGAVPCNAGAIRRVNLVTPPGTLVNPTFPAPTGWGLQHPGNEIAEAVCTALSKALPGRVGRVTANAMLLFSIHQLARHGQTVEQVEAFDFSNFVQGDSDASSEHDGWGMPGIAASVPLPSIELYEAERGGRIEQLEYASDSGGAGAKRGSPGTVAIISLPQPSAGALHLTAAVVPRVKAGAVAEHGGRYGSCNSITVDYEGKKTEVKDVIVNWQLPANAKITMTMSGGCGWGPPQRRSAERVRADVANGLVTVDAAREVYGVVLDEKTLIVDEAATKVLRSKLDSGSTVKEEFSHG
jgi:N-methylhydantoinase B